jgi:hypothetical protein
VAEVVKTSIQSIKNMWYMASLSYVESRKMPGRVGWGVPGVIALCAGVLLCWVWGCRYRGWSLVCYDICGWMLSILWVLVVCVGFVHSITQFGLRVGVWHRWGALALNVVLDTGVWTQCYLYLLCVDRCSYQRGPLCVCVRVCSIVVLVLLGLLSQNLMVWRMPCIDRLTYRSFMSSVIIFMCSSMCIVFSSSAASCAFLVVYVCGRFIRLFNFLLKYLAALYAGACMSFTTGLIGSICLCFYVYIEFWSHWFYVCQVFLCVFVYQRVAFLNCILDLFLVGVCGVFV